MPKLRSFAPQDSRDGCPHRLVPPLHERDARAHIVQAKQPIGR